MDAAIAKILEKDEEMYSDDDFVNGPSDEDGESEGKEGSDLPSSEEEDDEQQSGSEEEEEEDDDDFEGDEDLEPPEVHDSSSEDEEDQQEKDKAGRSTAAAGTENQTKGFLEGGKAETFARAFANILAEKPKHSITGAAPVLAASKSIAKRKMVDAEEAKADKEAKKLRLAMRRQGHVVPKRKGQDPAADVKEKGLQKTATKGVVQLFNAIAKAQKRLKEASEATGNRAKAAKLGKASFLSELRNMSKQQQQEQKRQGNQDEAAGDGDAAWDVLQEGFTGLKNTGKMKDWDRIDDDDDAPIGGGGGAPQQLEDSDSEGW